MSDSPPLTSTIYLDAFLVLLFPGTIPPTSADEPFRYTYIAAISFSTGRTLHVDISVAAIDKSTTLLPHNTVAHVVGPTTMIGSRLIVTASTVSAGPTGALGPDLAGLFKPLVLFGGVVTGRELVTPNGTTSGLQVIDVTVQRSPDWPHAPITLKCKLDEANEHVQALDNVDLDAVILVSGVLSGYDHGQLRVAIHDIGLEHDRFVCTSPALAGTARPVGSSITCVCHWFAFAIRRGLQTLKKSPTKRIRAAETDENR